jgi:hypothetical protein
VRSLVFNASRLAPCGNVLGHDRRNLDYPVSILHGGFEFLVMIAYKDGHLVCRECPHTVRPGAPEYRCMCRSCVGVGRKDDS